jgi:hypothetical protein
MPVFGGGQCPWWRFAGPVQGFDALLGCKTPKAARRRVVRCSHPTWSLRHLYLQKSRRHHAGCEI